MKLILGMVLLCASGVYSLESDCQRDIEVVCYWGSWSIYREDIGLYTTENIDPSLCTNIVYTFVGLNINSEIQSLDAWADIDLNGFANFTALKQNNSCLRTTLAIGGWNEGSVKYSVMASSEESRKSFANNVLRFLVYYGFDGIDVDWEYPTTRGGLPQDGDNYEALLRTIKETISPWGLILTIAVPIDTTLIGTAYHISAIAETVDYVHLMAYDYTASTLNVTGLSAPLSAIKDTISNWLDAGLPSKKLILGIPTYGRNYILEDESHHDIGDAILSVGIPGEFTSEAGFLAYYEVLSIITDPFLNMNIVEVDDTNYAYGSDEWITYENEKSARIKAQYALDQNLGGLMIWSLETDDFRGLYGPKYPILSAINDVIQENTLKN